MKYLLGCEIKLSQSVTRENRTSATSERDDHLQSTMRTISRTLPLGHRFSEIPLQTEAEIFPLRHENFRDKFMEITEIIAFFLTF